MKDAQAIEYLSHWVLPEIRHLHEKSLAKHLESTIASGRLQSLGTLAVREKTTFLSSLDHFIRGPLRSRPSPTVAVKLTASLDIAPQLLLVGERRRAVLPPR